MPEWSCETLLLLLPRRNHVSSFQGTGDPTLCHPSEGESFSVGPTMDALLPLYVSGDRIEGT